MRNLRLIILVTVVAGFCYATLTNTAAIRTEEFIEKLQGITLDDPIHLRIERASENGNEQQPKRSCYNTPCGWAIYVPFTRTIHYFMKNICDCPDESYKCVRTDDDLSANAYVYRCRQNTTVDDIESTEESY